LSFNPQIEARKEVEIIKEKGVIKMVKCKIHGKENCWVCEDPEFERFPYLEKIKWKKTAFRQYIASRFEAITLPILVAIIILLLKPELGLILLFGCIIIIIIIYFVFGRNLEIKEKEKEKKKEIFIYKQYYNREKVILGISAVCIAVVIGLALLNFCLPCFLGSMSLLIIGIVLFGCNPGNSPAAIPNITPIDKARSSSNITNENSKYKKILIYHFEW